MGSFVEGVFSVEIKNLSLLVAQCQGNEALSKAGHFKRMHYEKYGPFTLGDNEFEIRAYPAAADIVIINLCLLSDANVVKKFSSVTLYSDPQSNKWTVGVLVNDKEEFKADTIGEGLGLPMVKLQGFIGSHWKQHSKSDCLVLKLILGLYLDDDSKKVLEPQQTVPTDPNVRPPIPDLSTALLNGGFADIHCVVNGQTFPAHRAVLAARSSVFQSEFLSLQHEMCQNNGVFVSIQHVDALTFKNLLHFIYTDSLPPDFDELATALERYRRLFIAAHLFNVRGPKKICEEKLTRAVTDCIKSTLDLINFQDSELLKIIQKDCNMKPEIITSTSKVGDQLYSTSI